jgi:hypothetical protein
MNKQRIDLIREKIVDMERKISNDRKRFNKDIDDKLISLKHNASLPPIRNKLFQSENNTINILTPEQNEAINLALERIENQQGIVLNKLSSKTKKYRKQLEKLNNEKEKQSKIINYLFENKSAFNVSDIHDILNESSLKWPNYLQISQQFSHDDDGQNMKYNARTPIAKLDKHLPNLDLYNDVF